MEVRAQDREQGHDETDFDSFFRRCFPAVARAAALVARDSSVGQDLAQEAFVRLYPRWGDMDSVEHARNFVYRVAINLARSNLRRRLRTTSFGLRAREEQDPDPDPSVRATRWLTIIAALSSLSSRQRACVVLVDYAGFDAASAGRILGIGADTVRVHIMRGRRALRDGLGGGASEEGP